MIKRPFLAFLAFSLGMVFTLTACGSNRTDTSNNNQQAEQSTQSSVSTQTATNQIESAARVKLSFNHEQVIVKMDDNPTSRDFLSLLPLTLTFEDYTGTEKISYLPRKLSTQDALSGFDPSVGDLTLYAPWGNLAIFYRDFRHSNGLIKLGHIESGIEKMASMHGNFLVHIEQVK